MRPAFAWIASLLVGACTFPTVTFTDDDGDVTDATSDVSVDAPGDSGPADAPTEATPPSCIDGGVTCAGTLLNECCEVTTSPNYGMCVAATSCI
jgi:hypothetical protein